MQRSRRHSSSGHIDIHAARRWSLTLKSTTFPINCASPLSTSGSTFLFKLIPSLTPPPTPNPSNQLDGYKGRRALMKASMVEWEDERPLKIQSESTQSHLWVEVFLFKPN